MPNENEVQTQTTQTAPITPPVVVETPPIVAPPEVQAPPAQKREFKEPPHQAFMNRVKREAAMEVKRRLGVTIEEAEDLVKKGGTQQASGDQSATDKTVDKALAEARKEAEALRRENEGLKAQGEANKRKHEKEVRRLKNKEFEAKLSTMAARAGINDVDYALTLFAREALANKDIDPDKFFPGLRESKPHLFAATAAVTAPTVPVVNPTTVPVQSTDPGAAPPTPTAVGSATATKTADDMSPEEFNSHLRRSGWTPGS
jgi:hypothetical protein